MTVLRTIVPKKNRPATISLTSNELGFVWDCLTFAATHFADFSHRYFLCMFGFDNSVIKLDDYADFYSVEPIWIGQMKRVEAIDKLLQGAPSVSTKPKRKSNGLFTMMGKTVERQHSAAGGRSAGVTTRGVISAVELANTQQHTVSGGGGPRGPSSTSSTPTESCPPTRRVKKLPQQGDPWSGGSGKF